MWNIFFSYAHNVKSWLSSGINVRQFMGQLYPQIYILITKTQTCYKDMNWYINIITNVMNKNSFTQNYEILVICELWPPTK